MKEVNDMKCETGWYNGFNAVRYIQDQTVWYEIGGLWYQAPEFFVTATGDMVPPGFIKNDKQVEE